jgi:SAM-dependent methyltransferase
MPAEIANVEMATAWDGEEGDTWTEHADRYDAVARRIWQRFLDTDLIEVTDRVLDIGCGTGKTTRDAARAAASGSALGVDLSARMLACARERSVAEGVENIDFVQADAQVHEFARDEFDIAISGFGAMFFADPVAAFRNIAHAVRSGGRLALLSWQRLEDNEWLTAMRAALAAGRDLRSPPLGAAGPFGLADPEGVRHILGEAGFVEIDLVPLREPMRFGDDVEDAWSFVSTLGIVHGLTQDLDDATRRTTLDELRATLARHATDDGVLLDSAAWLITGARA